MRTKASKSLERLAERFEEVGRLLAEPTATANQKSFRELSMEYARLEPVAQRFREFHGIEQDMAAAKEMAADSDPETR